MKLPKVYEPNEYEKDIYDLWERADVFTAHPERHAQRFSISMPPPNETGTLSLGHALFLTLQDIMARHARQRGMDVLWLPGTDHAALPVNAIMEKKLAEEGTDKHAIGRDEFLARTREFVGNSRETMIGQMRAMGASCDWSRLRYTLDDALSRCVNETFVKMYEAGIIYQGHRIVNWDPKLETTIADDELEHETETATFYTFQYGPFQIGTARPETKFGDKYVVMHPADKRYAAYKHGQTFEADWINGVVKATVIKDDSVDPTFGTGVMTITPWHDHTDFDIAERHGLDKEQIIDFHGKLMPIAGEFAGLPIAEARIKVVEKLRSKGLVVKEDKKYIHNVAVNSRGKGKIEPQIKLQWFVDVNKPSVEWKGKKRSLKEVMRAVIDDGDIKIMPKRFEKVYFHWIDNLRDWCISRQIWWGHRIPVWYRANAGDEEVVYVGVTPPEADETEGWNEWQQDPDTLDTWFSSALWTWSTLVDQNAAGDYTLSLEELLKQSPDFQAYHPTTIMETGWDILFFWVARMILATTFVTGQVPFKTVYLHGMIRAEDGKKMSKSRPESIVDPLDVIPKYGTDALRMALVMGSTPGNDMNWGWGKIEATRNFANKLWNISRYIEDKLGPEFDFAAKPTPNNHADHWVLSKLQHLTDTMAGELADYRFAEAFDKLYHFTWDDFADWYIEASKATPNTPLLYYCLQTILTLAHPFAPFVTETIWQTLRADEVDPLALKQWPSVPSGSARAAKDFEEIRKIVSETRQLVTDLGLTDQRLYYHDIPFLSENGPLLKRLAHVRDVAEVAAGKGLQLTNTKHLVWLDVDNDTIARYLGQLDERRAKLASLQANFEARLANKAYVKHAPKDVVRETKKQLADTKEMIEKISLDHKRFTKLQV